MSIDPQPWGFHPVGTATLDRKRGNPQMERSDKWQAQTAPAPRLTRSTMRTCKRAIPARHRQRPRQHRRHDQRANRSPRPRHHRHPPHTAEMRLRRLRPLRRGRSLRHRGRKAHRSLRHSTRTARTPIPIWSPFWVTWRNTSSRTPGSTITNWPPTSGRHGRRHPQFNRLWVTIDLVTEQAWRLWPCENRVD